MIYAAIQFTDLNIGLLLPVLLSAGTQRYGVPAFLFTMTHWINKVLQIRNSGKNGHCPQFIFFQYYDYIKQRYKDIFVTKAKEILTLPSFKV